jgi:hypothetical protein
VPVEKIVTVEVEKEVIREREVPVEKIVTREIIKEVPIEKIVTKEIISLKRSKCPSRWCRKRPPRWRSRHLRFLLHWSPSRTSTVGA